MIFTKFNHLIISIHGVTCSSDIYLVVAIYYHTYQGLLPVSGGNKRILLNTLPPPRGPSSKFVYYMTFYLVLVNGHNKSNVTSGSKTFKADKYVESHD